jgi:hypothetical protein
MKAKTLFSAVAALLLMTGGARASTGYVNFGFQPGDNWFGNPLTASPNHLSGLIPTAPAGTTVSLWDSAANHYAPASTWNGSIWSTDLLLNPGTGALLHTPSSFVNTFVGEVLDFDGSLWGGGAFHSPVPFAGPSGTYLFSCMTPVALSGHVFDSAHNAFDVFGSIIGRAPHTGEQVTTLDALTQAYATTTFLGGGWDHGDPSLAVGGAAMFNLITVPEPSALGLVLAGLGVIGWARGRIRQPAADR